MDENLAALAGAHGVATWYEDADQRRVEVDRAVVLEILEQLEVDPSAPAKRPGLPDTIVVRQGTRYETGRGLLRTEDGGRLDVADRLPADLPLGWHVLEAGGRQIPLAVTPARLPDVPRAWGWMLQLYALHSRESWGMGDFGDLAAFAGAAHEHGSGVLLVNPVQAIVPTLPVNRSPYSPSSRRFANPLYIKVTDTDEFRAAGPDTRSDVLALAPGPIGGLIDYDAVWAAKVAALELLWPGEIRDLEPGLRDYATFCALAEKHGGDWREWPSGLRHPDSPDVVAARRELAPRVAFHAWLQEVCEKQLGAARAAASGMSVGIVHDLPVGVDPGGADAWALQDVLAPRVTVGAPPDAFSQQGQDWRLPPWRPDKLAAAGYQPFIEVLRSVLKHGDGIRVDHVAGLWRLWWIPPGQPPSRGTYVHYDSEAMLGILALEAHRHSAVVVGEDLGTVQPHVTTTLHERGMLSSAVLYFQRDYETRGHPFVPIRSWEPASMASISTHDLPTAAGFLEAENVRVRAELGLVGDVAKEYERVAAERRDMIAFLVEEGVLESHDATEDEILVAMHAVLTRARSALILTSPPDALGDLRQPNLPGTVDEYPNWRIPLPVPVEQLFSQPGVRRVVHALQTNPG
ncbi:4-alpha-glucanotransferase [Kibdelosporangium phytohabitans]|uniref:4-alpha-glucanotransferase n=1 Tax=Kibdelosporangium phytohabitans TaxID=860235 RepID=A0A0N9HST9_9PSEU|nr:4-alpha-glucanotransferase [Kibdelosporangium phytohabitans]ALG08092.1 4-alpha-glucanotransferase [Kibdelosporangium phytohabitans]